MTSRNLLLKALLPLAALLLASCASTASFNYAILPGSVPRYSPLPSGTSIAVLPFTDMRVRYQSVGEDDTAERGSFAAGWVPLMPFGWVEKRFPEQEHGHRFATLNTYWCQFDRELAQASADSLEFCGLFSRVYRAENAAQTDADWLFRGSYVLTEYQGERLTYGVTYLLAPFLWTVGFPCAVSHCRMALNFEIIERASGRVLWRFAYNGGDRLVQWLYYNYGEDTQRFTKLTNYALGAAIFDLKSAIDNQRAATSR